jgi:GDP-L-fucose synthase
MVIPSLIARAQGSENPLVVWGDGTPIRDFIHARDVARGMMLVVEIGETRPVNLGSGKGYTIREVAEIIKKNTPRKLKLFWDTSKPTGDKKRLMDISRARSMGFMPEISIEDGIAETIEWYKSNKHLISKRYNVFTKNDEVSDHRT